jgi:hypothetical protein
MKYITMEKESPIIIKFMDVDFEVAQNKEYLFQNIGLFW